eukprot:scaffold3827_cov179-Cylindrotheca_fusiformis.AAC.17
METYPGELLVGVFPLVFCVDATLNSKSKNDKSSEGVASSSPTSRTQFDRFLDAMAASLMDDPEGDHPLAMMNGTTATPSKDVLNALLRNSPSVVEDDDDDEILLKLSSRDPLRSQRSFDSFSTATSTNNNNNTTTTSPPKRPFGIGRNKSRTASSASNDQPQQHNLDTSFAKALQNGQGFFQRARIVSISSRHGFPPSKDPSGDNNRLHEFYKTKTFQIDKLVSAIEKKPIDGILPSGWMGKHAHALPSVILVVVQVAQDQSQFAQDDRLTQTLDNLQYSLASKRECAIQIVGLVQEGVSNVLAEQWSANVQNKVKNGETILLLNVADLQQQGAPSSMALQYLHKFTRQASYTYYATQAHKTRLKLTKLGPARLNPVLLPLSIRYCFKIAMFHEFQWQQQKSVKFMVEAYRNAEAYYRYLLQQKHQTRQQQKHRKNEQDGTTPPSLMDKVSMSNDSTQSTMDPSEVGGEGFEMALQSPNKTRGLSEEELRLLRSSPTPEDMIYQCRKIADWLNFKIIQSGLVSHTQGGLSAASRQWQKHSQAFCSPRRSFLSNAPKFAKEAWLDWAYVAHQRMVFSQLLERNPPNAVTEGMDRELQEILLRCSPWRTYEATAEAILQLGAEIRRLDPQTMAQQPTTSKKKNEMRAKYIGGLDADENVPNVAEEAKVDHRENALDCIKRAISLFERDCHSTKEDTSSWNRSVARLHYLAGGTLLGMERYEEAISYLDKAATSCKGWAELEVTVRRLLIKCYEKHIPSQVEGNSQSLASMLLDSYFNAQMSNADLRKALGKFSTLSGGGSVKWYRDCIDEADSTLPFSFFLSFPSITHAFAGEKVKASLYIKSNLDYAVHVDSVTLLSLAGPVRVPSNDLLSAKNADEGSGGGIIIQSKAEIILSTEIQLPKDLNEIAIDETGNGGEKEGVAGKGSFSKTARPRTGGITAGAGARLLQEGSIGEAESRKGSSQWSLRCLGGRPLRCDGLQLVFYPVHSAAVGEGANTIVELTIEKKHDKTETNIKRTPFEEDNYIASAWKRPRHIPMIRGPRCLRVLSPMPDMVVSNLTEQFTNGKAIEGTVNRILLRLKAGHHEICADVRIKINCSSFLVSPEGKVRRLVDSETAALQGSETEVSEEDPRVRTPTLLELEPKATGAISRFGYKIPVGWSATSRSPKDNSTGFRPVVATLKSGDSTYVYIDLYRPSPSITNAGNSVQVEDDGEFDQDMCQTDVDVSVSYRQERAAPKAKQIPIRRKSRMKPGEESVKEGEDKEKADLVSLEFSSRVRWVSPIAAHFSAGMKTNHPCGNRHPSNNLPYRGDLSPRAEPEQTEMVVLDGHRVSTKCTLEAVAAEDGFAANIKAIKFEDNWDKQQPCSFKIVSGKNSSGLLYEAEPGNPCQELELGSIFSFAWVTEVAMKKDSARANAESTLGVVSVDWTPVPHPLPDGITPSDFDNSISEHGPLQLATTSTCSFRGPPFYIEKAPFEVKRSSFPSSAKVATPLDITYMIENNTQLHQTLHVVLNENDFPDDQPLGYLVSGLSDGKVSLGPNEVFSLTYSLIATRTGKISMPPVCVSSDRYGTWVIKDEVGDRQSLFILP